VVDEAGGEGRKRKHRWETAKGHVIAVRFTDEQFESVSRRAATNEMSPGEYVKWLATREHRKGGKR
jgi:hypothetical protein